jgi:hypothetical protein
VRLRRRLSQRNGLQVALDPPLQSYLDEWL